MQDHQLPPKPPRPAPRQTAAPDTRRINGGVPQFTVDDSNWTRYFDRQIQLELPDTLPHETSSSDSSTAPAQLDRFTVYMAGSVHYNILLCLHGGGQTSLSWSLVASRLKKFFCVVAFDCRGHGLTQSSNESQLDKDTLVRDTLRLIHKLREWIDKERKDTPLPEECVTPAPVSVDAGNAEYLESQAIRDKILFQFRGNGVPIILMGHSLGGAIAIHCAATQQVPNLQGLVVLDVVEDTALEALPQMETFVQQFPASFRTREEAVEWSLKHILQNRESATISIPSQLKWDESDKLWKWRVSIAATSKYWDGWFRGLSKKFLEAKVGSGGKILVLVGTERLDKELTIAHMQGRFQLLVLPKSGHIIEEDQPDDVEEVILSFANRFRLLPPAYLASTDPRKLRNPRLEIQP